MDNDEQKEDQPTAVQDDGTIVVKQLQVPLWVTQEWLDDQGYLRQALDELAKGKR